MGLLTRLCLKFEQGYYGNSLLGELSSDSSDYDSSDSSSGQNSECVYFVVHKDRVEGTFFTLCLQVSMMSNFRGGCRSFRLFV